MTIDSVIWTRPAAAATAGRVGACALRASQALRVLTAAGDVDHANDGRTPFPQTDAQAGACSAQGVLYGAAIAAGLMVHQLARWLREARLERDVALNLRAGECNVARPDEADRRRRREFRVGGG
ncbi:MAG: hypothetical protein C0485_17735 [Pirellula sp.]|nr:hypothetical protein [Pirellula sp.]